MKTRRKITASFLLTIFVFCSMVIPSVAKAQTQNSPNWWQPSFVQFSQKVGTDPAVGGSAPNEIYGERYTYAQVSWIISSLVAILGGPVTECAAAYKDNGAAIAACITKKLTGTGMGPTMSVLALGDSLLITKPASGIDYVAEKLHKFNIVTPAYAQNAGGYGFSQSLLPIQPLWVAARNAAFALTTFAIIILAFMIMFRAKISPQVVISAQSALPKVAIGLVFITFSYAIAGFVIDLGFVVQGVIAAIVSAAGISTANPLAIFNQIQNGMGSLLAYGVGFLFESFSGGGIVGKIINTGTATGSFNLLSSVLFPIIDTILALIILIILLIVAIRILWLLIMTYAKVIFLVLGGPFVALMAIAGQGSGIGGWVKKLASEVSVFVAIGVLIMFAHIIFYSFGNGATAVQGLGTILNVNPFGITINATVNNGGLMPSGFSFGYSTAAVGFFVSLAIMLSIPKLASAVRDQIANGRGSYGFGIGEAAAPVANPLLGYGSSRYAAKEAALRPSGLTPNVGWQAGKGAIDAAKGLLKRV